MPQPSEQAREYLTKGNLCFSKNNSKVQAVQYNNPTNKRGYTFLGFCEDDIWTAKRCKAVYEHLNSEGYNWYTLSHDRVNGRPYLGKRVPQVDQYDTQVDKYDIPSPVLADEQTEDKGKQPEYQTDYDSDSTNPKPTKESHSTDNELKQEASLDTSIIRNSPIGIRPKLSPTILTSVIMSATTTQPTITVQATMSGAATGSNMTTTVATGSTSVTPTQRITAAINKALRRNPGSGPGGPRGPEGPGAPGGSRTTSQSTECGTTGHRCTPYGKSTSHLFRE